MREERLVLASSPCTTNLYGSGPKTLKEARKEGVNRCPHFEICKEDGILRNGRVCILQLGVHLAQNCIRKHQPVSRGVNFFRGTNLRPPNGFIWSPDRQTFVILSDRDEALRRTQQFAREVLRPN